MWGVRSAAAAAAAAASINGILSSVDGARDAQWRAHRHSLMHVQTRTFAQRLVDAPRGPYE